MLCFPGSQGTSDDHVTQGEVLESMPHVVPPQIVDGHWTPANLWRSVTPWANTGHSNKKQQRPVEVPD